MAGKSPLKPGLARPSPSFRLNSPSLNTVRLRRVFDLCDRNGDGEITIEELWSALDRLGLGLGADPTDLVAPHIRPGHAGLAFDDFVGLHRTLSDALDAVGGAGEEADMVEAFKVFDEDGDGFISAKELQAVLGKLGLLEGESTNRINQMISSVDSNHDSRVDFHEFRNLMVGITVKSA